MLPPRRPGYSVVLGELQDHNHQDDDHQYTDDRADQSSVHGPLPSPCPDERLGQPRAVVRLPLKAILVYNVKLAAGKNSLVTLAAAIAMGMPLIPRAGAGQVRRALPGSPPQADAVDAPAARQ